MSMTTRTKRPSEMTLAEIEAENRAHWPANAIRCQACHGSGGDFYQHERCGACLGFGFVAKSLYAIFSHTAADALAQSDKAAQG